MLISLNFSKKTFSTHILSRLKNNAYFHGYKSITMEEALTEAGAFEKAFKTHYPGAVIFARKYVGDLDTARDIAQQVFVNLYEKRNSIEINTSLKSYIFQAVKNTSLNYISQQSGRQKHNEIIKAGLVTSYEQEDLAEYGELEQKLHKIIDQLPDKCRQIFKMNRFDGKKNKEIAESLNLSIRTVETQISKALKYLRKEVPKDLLHFFIFLNFF